MNNYIEAQGFQLKKKRENFKISQNLKFKVCLEEEENNMVLPYALLLQFEFGNVDLWWRICICLIVDLLAQGTQFCESGYQVNLKKRE